MFTLAAVGRLSREPQTALLTVSGLWFISLTGTVMTLPGSSFVSVDEHWLQFFFPGGSLSLSTDQFGLDV